MIHAHMWMPVSQQGLPEKRVPKQKCVYNIYIYIYIHTYA